MGGHVWQLQGKALPSQQTPYCSSNGMEGAWDCIVPPNFPVHGSVVGLTAYFYIAFQINLSY